MKKKNLKKIKNKKELLIISFVFFILNISFSYATDINDFFAVIPTVLDMFARIFIGLVLVIVFWGFVKFMFQDKKEEGKALLIWGITGLFLIFSVWAIVFFLQKTTFGTDNGKMPDPPAL